MLARSVGFWGLKAVDVRLGRTGAGSEAIE
jgi:hypothetical protein